MIYFGCIKTRRHGHALYRPDGRGSSWDVHRLLEKVGIYPKIDGGFCPGMEDGKKHFQVDQVEGHAKLTHFNGWTILAFWDRSGDGRGNSNSAFLEQGKHSFEYMISKSQKEFNWVWSRFTFDVVNREWEIDKK